LLLSLGAVLAAVSSSRWHMISSAHLREEVCSEEEEFTDYADNEATAMAVGAILDSLDCIPLLQEPMAPRDAVLETIDDEELVELLWTQLLAPFSEQMVPSGLIGAPRLSLIGASSPKLSLLRRVFVIIVWISSAAGCSSSPLPQSGPVSLLPGGKFSLPHPVPLEKAPRSSQIRTDRVLRQGHPLFLALLVLNKEGEAVPRKSNALLNHPFVARQQRFGSGSSCRKRKRAFSTGSASDKKRTALAQYPFGDPDLMSSGPRKHTL
ncbi:unnamed protein product, partial [Cyprideis torosa]